ncbi:hypothetical protein BDP81DRAFT_435267 [Colletotrichum phormii]|uniref:Uncharacterized protein n=1 Tax=Colletotrichum phormii TaxID=359342 RepID=A0AAJ0EC15_9PEZI|nr:uncharacterized protein BDP81DRAFT_435267 [Colletotrichum phormii]KAK1625710.1 hypothetical protein BDP81DRAFT_435267 [Colletotrichum phormii]
MKFKPGQCGKEEGCGNDPNGRRQKEHRLDKGPGGTTTARRMTDRAERDGGGNNWKIEEPIMRSTPHYPHLTDTFTRRSRSPRPGVKDPAPETDRAGPDANQGRGMAQGD